MKTLYLLGVIYIGLALTSCASLGNDPSNDQAVTKAAAKTVAKSPAHQVPPKNPLTVSFYPKGNNPKHPFKVIGTETVSKYNTVGIKRQEAIIRDAMRKIAAAMGGDAVIDITHDQKVVTGTVVSYEKKKNLA
jgi:hypothetical protein